MASTGVVKLGKHAGAAEVLVKNGQHVNWRRNARNGCLSCSPMKECGDCAPLESSL